MVRRFNRFARFVLKMIAFYFCIVNMCEAADDLNFKTNFGTRKFPTTESKLEFLKPLRNKSDFPEINNVPRNLTDDEMLQRNYLTDATSSLFIGLITDKTFEHLISFQIPDTIPLDTILRYAIFNQESIHGTNQESPIYFGKDLSGRYRLYTRIYMRAFFKRNGKWITLEPENDTGFAENHLIPSTAEISIDNEEKDNSMLRIKLVKGKHDATIKANGYLPQKITFQIRPGETTQITANLVPSTGYLKILFNFKNHFKSYSDPNLKIFLDGNYVQLSDSGTIMGVSTDTKHTLQIEHPYYLFSFKTDSFTVVRNRPTTIKPIMTQNYGRIELPLVPENIPFTINDSTGYYSGENDFVCGEYRISWNGDKKYHSISWKVIDVKPNSRNTLMMPQVQVIKTNESQSKKKSAIVNWKTVDSVETRESVESDTENKSNDYTKSRLETWAGNNVSVDDSYKNSLFYYGYRYYYSPKREMLSEKVSIGICNSFNLWHGSSLPNYSYLGLNPYVGPSLCYSDKNTMFISNITYGYKFDHGRDRSWSDFTDEHSQIISTLTSLELDCHCIYATILLWFEFDQAIYEAYFPATEQGDKSIPDASFLQAGARIYFSRNHKLNPGIMTDASYAYSDYTIKARVGISLKTSLWKLQDLLTVNLCWLNASNSKWHTNNGNSISMFVEILPFR